MLESSFIVMTRVDPGNVEWSVNRDFSDTEGGIYKLKLRCFASFSVTHPSTPQLYLLIGRPQLHSHNMDEPFTTLMTTVYDYSGTVSGPTDYEDYDTGPTENTGMCDRSWVREFRGQYEPPLFSLIFILGAVGNLLVVWIYTTVRNRLKTMTDVYLLNLAVADLLFLCMLPFWAVDAVKGWDFGISLCKVVSAIYKINFFSSMFLLTCISVDRYIAIVQVTKAEPEPDLLACVSVCSEKEAVLQQTCLPVCLICMGFCLPLLVMIFCYSIIIRTLMQARSFEKHKALRVIFAVVFVFVLSQLPYNSLLIVEAAQAANTTITECDTLIGFDIAGQVAKSLAFTHACLNPFLYVFIGVRFRQDLLRIAKMCVGGLGAGGLSKTQAVPKRPSVIC
ncbi:hypothetical protein L3Q82_004663 [Scortum barcoo]|uniref:Uncharacterized protein n=1 Tax=Scortum barcoo TaxID=214431 RepID=A0ACB8VGX3_9TELE|nr:hypothetical protein L3Q82_004663 [Scortum barcoo]